MADNVTLPATGTFAADDIAGILHPRMKLSVGADGSAADLSFGVKTGANSLPVVLASDQAAVPVRDTPTIVTVDVTSAGLTTATNAYSAGNVLGTLITAAVASATGRPVRILSALLTDKANVLGPVDVNIYSATVTLAADRAAQSVSDTDLLLLLGTLSFGGANVGALNRSSQLLGGLPLTLVTTSSANVFVEFVTRSGHTFFGAAGDIRLRLTVEQL